MISVLGLRVETNWLLLKHGDRDVSFNKLTGELPSTIGAERLKFV